MAKKKIVFSENTRNLVIGIAIALVTLVISYNIIYKSYIKRRNQLHSRILEENQRLILRKEISELFDLKEKYHGYLYKTKDTNVLRSGISALARNSGVDIVSIQPQKPKQIGKYSKVSFNLRVKCSYNQLGRFIEGIEAYPTLTKVERFTIKGSTRGVPHEKDTTTEVSLLITAYCTAR